MDRGKEEFEGGLGGLEGGGGGREGVEDLRAGESGGLGGWGVVDSLLSLPPNRVDSISLTWGVGFSLCSWAEMYC